MEPAFLRAAGPSGALSPDAKAKVLSSKAASICKAKPPAAEAAPVPADPQEADEEEYVTVEVEAEVPIAEPKAPPKEKAPEPKRYPLLPPECGTGPRCASPRRRRRSPSDCRDR